MRNDRNNITFSDIPLPTTEMLERQVIADGLNNPEIVGDLATIITPDSFTSDERVMMWNNLTEMYNKRETIDMVSFWQKVGQPYIEEIQRNNIPLSMPTAAFDHAVQLRGATIKRHAYYEAARILQQAAQIPTTEEEILGIIDEFSRKIQGEGRQDKDKRLNAVLEDVAAETEREQMEAQQGRSVRIPTGFPSLDYLFYGGFNKGHLIILAARPSVGKTAVMLQFAKSAARAGNPAMIFSLEMTREELGRRLLFSTGLVSPKQLAGKDVNWGAFEQAKGAIDGLPIYICTDTYTMPAISAKLTAAVNRGLCKIAFIDYLGLIRTDMHGSTTLAQQIGAITSEMKRLALYLRIPIVLLVQLNRESAKEGRDPQIYDLRDSGNIEQDADVIMMLKQHQENPSRLDIIVRKNRNFKKDVTLTTEANSSYSNFTQVGTPDWDDSATWYPQYEDAPQSHGNTEPF